MKKNEKKDKKNNNDDGELEFYLHSHPMNKEKVNKGSKANDVYLNRVSDELINSKNNTRTIMISIPDSKSATGFGNFFVNAKMICETTKKGTGEPIPKMNDINLGSPDNNIDYSISKNNAGVIKAVVKTIKASEIKDKWEKVRDRYRSRSLIEENKQSDAEVSAETPYDVDSEDYQVAMQEYGTVPEVDDVSDELSM